MYMYGIRNIIIVCLCTRMNLCRERTDITADNSKTYLEISNNNVISEINTPCYIQREIRVCVKIIGTSFMHLNVTTIHV